MEAARPAAFILPALFGKQLPPFVHCRLLPALGKAITHAVDEVVKYAVQGIAAYLWRIDRSLALTCIHTLIMEATEQNRFWAEQRLQPLAERSSGDEFETALQTRLRDFVETRKSGDDSTILQLDLTNWPGRQVAAHLFTILGEQPTDPLAIKFFKHNAANLATRWIQDDERRRPGDEFPNDEGELDHGIEHQLVDSLAQFVLQLPPTEAVAIIGPLFVIATRFPEKAAEFVQWLITRQGERTPAPTLWLVWQKFADDFSASALPTSVDDKHSNSSKLLRELFLGENWGETRDWKPLHGEQQRVRALFDQLPASRQSLEAYAYFLSKIGSSSLPEALLSIAAKVPAVKGSALFSETAVFYFETILTRLIYGGNREIRVQPKLRHGTMILLDVLVAAGSSVAYKLRDDFLTPASK